MSTDSRIYVLSCVGLMLAVLALCLIAAHGCAGSSSQAVETPASVRAAQGSAEMEATVDLGLAVVELQADATVAPPVEVSVCIAATVQALAVLRVEVSWCWEIVPSPATWHLCVDGFGLRRCLDG